MTVTALPELDSVTDVAVEPPPEQIKKVSIIISKGSLEGVYPGLIMANGARMEGIEANVFFTFFGMEAIQKKRADHLKVATVGNPGMHIPTWLGGFPGMSGFATSQMKKKIEELDIPPVPEFLELINDSGGNLFACKATVEMFGLTKDDFVPEVDSVITVGDFYEMAAGGEIIFT
jgi:peroxiredoxin family protein